MVDMARQHADDYQINMFIPDLHSFTTPIDHSVLSQQILANAKVYVAAGLPIDHPRVFLYRQSHIQAHAELTWILSCFTGVGEMSRMTQFKDKSGSLGDERTSVGLFSYPILMAADILLYQAKYVPVGADQTQHIEFTRTIADRLNSQFKQELFALPLSAPDQAKFFGLAKPLKIQDLKNPAKKMSKSAESESGVIFVDDNPTVAHKKIMSATTDSLAKVNYDPKNQPGVSNLLQVLALIKDQPVDKITAELSGMTRYGDFKKIVADEVSQFLTELQTKLTSIEDEVIQKKLADSEREMALQAEQTLSAVETCLGLR